MTEEENVFLRAIEVSRENRGAFVDAAVDGNDALRQKMQQLLEAHEAKKVFLDRPCAESGSIALILSEISSHMATGGREGIGT